MPLFEAYDLKLQSAVSFPELFSANGKKADLVFRVLPGDRQLASSAEWFHSFDLPDGTAWLRLGRKKTEYLLRFPDMADFVVSSNGGDVDCFPATATPPETIRHLFLDQVLPLLLSHQGRLVLHASAVATPKGAVAFLGMAGVGKSTLAASFCQQGFLLLTDDCFLVEERGREFFAIRSYPGLRLWADTRSALSFKEPCGAPVAHYTIKQRIGEQNGKIRFSRRLTPVHRIYVLEPWEEQSDTNQIRISPLRSRNALMELVKWAYRLDITDHRRNREQFEALSRVLVSAPIFRLQFPHDFSRLTAVRNAVLNDLDDQNPA